MALAALALVVFGAIECPPIRTNQSEFGSVRHFIASATKTSRKSANFKIESSCLYFPQDDEKIPVNIFVNFCDALKIFLWEKHAFVSIMNYA